MLRPLLPASRLYEAGPRAADLLGCSSRFIGDRRRPFGFPEQAVPPAVPPGPIGVPAVEERGLLVRIGDLGAHLGQEVITASPRSSVRASPASAWSGRASISTRTTSSSRS
jgi:hypothetical protein